MQPFSNPSVHCSAAVLKVRMSSNAALTQNAVTWYLVAPFRNW
jgi:hypothetical protein